MNQRSLVNKVIAHLSFGQSQVVVCVFAVTQISI